MMKDSLGHTRGRGGSVLIASLLVAASRTIASLLLAAPRTMAYAPRSSSALQKQHNNNNYNEDKRIVFVRHGCTYMNEYLGRAIPFGAPNFSDVFERKDLERYYRDSPLSPLGVRQARNLLGRTNPPPAFLPDCDLIVTSPLTRALQTLELGLLPHFSLDQQNNRSPVPIIALPQAAERLYLISDIGKTPSVLQEKFPFVDFETGFQGQGYDDDEEWWYKPSKQKKNYVEWRPTGQGQRYACPAEPQDYFDERMRSLVSWLDQRPERKIAVVCHWGVIDWMINDDFANCEWREVSHALLQDRAGILTESSKQATM